MKEVHSASSAPPGTAEQRETGFKIWDFEKLQDVKDWQCFRGICTHSWVLILSPHQCGWQYLKQWIKQQQTRNYEVISLWCSRNIYSHSVELCVGIATVFYIYQVRKKNSQNVCYDTTRKSVFRENHLPKHAEGNHSFLSKVLWKAFLEWKGLSIWF